MTAHLEQLRTALADRFGIERELGQGGMATVYLARDLKHDRQVALKVLRPELAATMGSDRFLREVRIAANLSHPHILPLYDSGEASGFLFYAMPFVEGESLRARLDREGELPVGEAVRVLKEVVDALAYAHAHRVVHRDIKPDNILLSGRHALVSDFGVAKAVSEATGRQTLTTAGVALGTPAYMAPEQATADPHVDHRADLYAVGVVAYELLTGRVPFNETTAQGMLAAHVTQAPEPVTAHRPAVPAALAQIVMRCLEKKPADRWQSAEELLPQLEALATPSGAVTPAHTQPVSALPIPKRAVTWALVSVAGLAVVAAAILGVRTVTGRGPPVDAGVVAVLPFRVTGDASLADLHEGMVDLLHARFTGEGGPRAVDPRTMLSAWRQAVNAGDGDLPLDAALPVARKVGAGLLLLGGIVETGGRLTVNASLHRVPRGAEIATASVTGTRDSLPQLIDLLAIQLLSLQAGESRARLSTLSGSVEAVRAYLAGQHAYRSGRMLEAVGHLDRAVGLDSSFVLGGLALAKAAVAAGNTNTDALSRVGPLVWRLRDQLSPRDRAVVLAAWGRNTPGWTSTSDHIADAERAVELAPDDAFAWTLLGQMRAWLARYVGDSAGFGRAAGVLDRAVELDSNFAIPLAARLETAVAMDDRETIRRLRDRYLAIDSAGEMVEFWRWRAALALGDSAELAAARETLGRSTQVSLTRIGYATVFDGIPLDDWVLATERFERRAVTARARDQALEQRRKIAIVQGRAGEAVALSDSLIARGFFVPAIRGQTIRLAILGAGHDASAGRYARAFREALNPGYNALCDLGLWDLHQGDTTGAARLLGRLDSLVRRGATPICPLLLRTMLDAMRGRPWPPSAARLDSLLRLDEPDNSGLPHDFAHLTLARLLERAGDPAGALTAVRRRTSVGVNVTSQVLYPSLLREEGRLAALAGDTVGAIRAYQHYLTLRTNPDAAVKPEVDEVRAALAGLLRERR